MKLFLHEAGSHDAAALWHGIDRLRTGRIAFVETRAALEAAHRACRLSRPGLAQARADLQRRWPALDVVELDADLAASAAELAEIHALRAVDSVHLAGALAFGDDVVLVTWDHRLRVAAAAAGLAVAPSYG